MSLDVPGVGSVPVEWVASPDFNSRGTNQPIAIVHHRAVSSSLAGIVKTLATKDTRPVSAHFAIGWDGSLPKVVQLVNLSDNAWCNGDCQARTYPDQPSRWDAWYGHRAHNERTVSIEHEDNGGSKDPLLKGIVDEPIIRTSIALDRLMLSGDLAAIRAAGIRCRDASTATALGKIPADAKHLLHHNDIAGKLKPYCWRPWQADKVGFPRARYIAELTAPAPQEEDVPQLSSYIPGQVATVKATANIRTAPKLSASVLRVSSGETWTVTGWTKGDVDPDGGSDQWLCRWAGGRWEYTAKSNVTAVAPPADSTPYSKAQVDAARSEGYAAAKAKATAAVAAI